MIGTSDGQAYEDGMDHLMNRPMELSKAMGEADPRERIPQKFINEQTSPQKTIDDDFDAINKGKWEGVIKGPRSSLEGQQYAMMDKRPGIMTDIPGGGFRVWGEGGSGGPVDKQKLIGEQLKNIPEKKKPAVELTDMEQSRKERLGYEFSKDVFDMWHGDDRVGHVALTPQDIGDKKMLHVDYITGFKEGATETERLAGALEFKRAMHEKYPDAIGFYGMRISGGKNKYGGDPYQYVPLTDEYSRKDLKKMVDEHYWIQGTTLPSYSAGRRMRMEDWDEEQRQQQLQERQEIMNLHDQRPVTGLEHTANMQDPFIEAHPRRPSPDDAPEGHGFGDDANRVIMWSMRREGLISENQFRGREYLSGEQFEKMNEITDYLFSRGITHPDYKAAEEEVHRLFNRQ